MVFTNDGAGSVSAQSVPPSLVSTPTIQSPGRCPEFPLNMNSADKSQSQESHPPTLPFGVRGLDHLAIAVRSTDEALQIWRDRFGFPVVCSELVNGGAVRLTHLDLGNTHLQLVEPLSPGHPLHAWLAQHGPGLHHFCLRVDDVGASHAALLAAGLAPAAPAPHQGTQGKRALFLARGATQDVQVEITGG